MIYDGRHPSPIPKGVLLIDHGKINYVGLQQSAPSFQAAEILDVKDAYIIPGLIDLHVHCFDHHGSLESFLRNGVTTIRDLASDPFHGLECKHQELSGKTLSPRVYFSGPILTCPGGYPTQLWNSQISLLVKGRFQAQEKVKWLDSLGIDVIKIGLENELGPCLSETEIKAITTMAHDLGKKVTAHLTNEKDFELCLKGSVDELAHIPARPVSDDLWKEAILKGIRIVPTIHAHWGWACEWKKKEAHPFGHHCYLGFESGYKQALGNLERFLNLGGKIIYGTDAGNPFLPFGVSVEEWKDLRQAGLSLLECLSISTIQAAEALGCQEQVGSLEVGKFADLGIYTDNPLDNPENFKTIILTLKNGKKIAPQPVQYPKAFNLDFWINQWNNGKNIQSENTQ
jgi:hypothetical protein